MRRPRHREKSNLLWKMVGVAGAVNVVLWPILIHAGVFAGIRHETLVPVSLVSLPPSKKLPDTLEKVSHTKTAIVPTKTKLAAVKAAPTVQPVHQKVTATAVASIMHQAKPSSSVRVASADILNPPVPLPVTHPAIPTSVVHRPQSHLTPSVHQAPAHPVVHPVDGSQIPHVRVPTAAERSLIAARLARAKALEAEARSVAEKIAHDRTTQVATVPPRTSGGPTTAVATIDPNPPGGASGTPGTQTDTVAIVEPPKPSPKPSVAKVAAPAAFVPAVAVSKVYPTVPDRMMTTSWRATFQGQMTVHPDGTTTVQMVSSTGHPVLDRRAMEAARRWKFQPARRDGKAVASTRPVVFEYDVHPVH